ncbi:MAG: hypothetical protein Q9169_005970 [Polycauliona sp. 2 TL-2023]
MEDKDKPGHSKCSVCGEKAGLVCKACKGAPDDKQGSNSTVLELEIRFKNPGMMLLHVRPDGSIANTPERHSIFKITLPNKESYALDLTAPQYGWYGPAIIPWATFEAERLDTISSTHDLGAMTKYALSGGWGSGTPTVLKVLKDALGRHLATWQQHNQSFQGLLGCSEEDLTKNQSRLLSFVDQCLAKDIVNVNKFTRLAASEFDQ